MPYNLGGLSRDASQNVLSVLIKEIILRAHRLKVPIIVEYLDFRAKKREWQSAGYNRMLSSFAYHQFHTLLRAAAAKLGVEVIDINPRNTTSIGIFKFQGYGFSKDQAAAVAIARRGLGFSERVGGRQISALLLPVVKQLAGDKGRHVSAPWPRLRRSLKLTGNGWQLKGRSVKTGVKAAAPAGCRVSKQGRAAGALSLKDPAAIGPPVTPSCDKDSLVSVG